MLKVNGNYLSTYYIHGVKACNDPFSALKQRQVFIFSGQLQASKIMLTYRLTIAQG